MAHSQVGIVNIALIRGKSTTIASMDESSTAARTASAVWEYIAEEVMSCGVPWNFAKQTAKLVQDSTTPDDYDYRYAKPAGCLRIISVKQEDLPVVYVERGDYLYTDTDNSTYDIIIEYVEMVEDYAKWTASFINAFAYRLAAEIGAKIESIDVNAMLQKYEVARLEAMGHNQAQDYGQDTGSTSWETAGR